MQTAAATSPSTNATAPVRGYGANKDQLRKRLRRIEGQVCGVESMVAGDRYCIDILTQTSAVQAALNKVALGLVDEHVRHCVIDGPDELKEQRTEELMAAVARLTRQAGQPRNAEERRHGNPLSRPPGWRPVAQPARPQRHRALPDRLRDRRGAG